jgi:hypothetical protein
MMLLNRCMNTGVSFVMASKSYPNNLLCFPVKHVMTDKAALYARNANSGKCKALRVIVDEDAAPFAEDFEQRFALLDERVHGLRAVESQLDDGCMLPPE